VGTKMKKSQDGFSAVEGLLIAVIVGMLGGVGWYVWHANSQVNKNLNAAESTKLAIQSAKPINTFDDCKNTHGSKLLGTLPEQCITNDGKKFSQTTVADKSFTLENGKVSFSYSSKEWLLVPIKQEHCGQDVTSSAICTDHASLMLQKDGNVNSDQFMLNIGVFPSNGYKDAKSWFLKYLIASEGGEPKGPSKTEASTINGLSSYFEQSDYGSEESRLNWGILGTDKGVLVTNILFKGNHYSFQNSNDYFPYRSDVENIVKSIKIN
jgi:hypothetical protein